MHTLNRTCRRRAHTAPSTTSTTPRIGLPITILFHHGVPKPAGGLLAADTRQRLAELDLPDAEQHAIGVALAAIDRLSDQLEPIDNWLCAYARRQPGCRAIIDDHYGIGPVTATAIVAELGDARRFPNREAVVRYAGLDVTVHSSDGNRAAGKLAKQGPGLLRWALVEAAHTHARPGADHHNYYQQVRARIDANRAALSVARKLLRAIRHTLAGLGQAALAPVDDEELPDLATVSSSLAEAA